MPVSIPHLRRWFVLAAVALSLVVAAVYLHRRRQVREVLKHIPGKMNVDIQQTAEGFKISKSEGGRTLFTIQAKKVVQFKLGGRAELSNVTITLYGRYSSRYDQIYGDDFAYDPKSGDVTAKGEVRIDLETNPEGLLKPDQSVPTTLKSPIHLVTRDLMFNQKTGNAFTNAKVELRMPQAAGTAMGVHYTAEENVLTLESQVELHLTGSDQTTLTASRGTISKTPRQVVLEYARINHGPQQIQTQRATVSLKEDNSVDRVVASEGVEADLRGDSPMHARAVQAEFKVNEAQDGLSHAVLTGNVEVDAAGDRPSRANAGRVVINFAARNVVSNIRAEDNVKLIELPPAAQSKSADAQQVEISAPAIDFVLAKGKHLDHAETSAAANIAILPSASDGPRTTITAGKFAAKFDERSRLNSLHGAPDARIVNTTPSQPDRSSTSQALDVAFRPAGGIDSIVQQGDVVYTDGEREVRGTRARYTPADQLLEVTGSPRVTDKGLTTTARTLRLNRATGDAVAEGEVKSTYNDLREQPNGALLASSSPIHITARTMIVHRTTAVATYTGDARIWQDANVVQAPTLQFDRDRRSVVAQGDGQPVSTVLVQLDTRGNSTPVLITSSRLTYTDDQHRAHFEGGVTTRGADASITADHLDAFMVPRSQAANRSLKGHGQLDRVVAEGNVSIQEPARYAQGEKLVYTVAEDKFVLTGGSPSIFDAEHGKITGDSLTFYKRDDRVLVEGKDTSPTVTQTRVAR
jgi:lipopolysaccharide export system protein LptA